MLFETNDVRQEVLKEQKYGTVYLSVNINAIILDRFYMSMISVYIILNIRHIEDKFVKSINKA